MDVLQAARILRPGTAWNLQGDVLSQAEDGTPRVKVPASDEINTVIAKYDYIEKRVSEYPPIGDQLDALWSGGKDADDMKSKVLAVKSKYPKSL